MWTDPIADLLTRIRNGLHNRSKVVTAPYSNFKLAICRVLKEEGFINEVERIEGRPCDQLRVTLKYGPRGEQVLRILRRESRAGRRKYLPADQLPKVLNGLGICIVSTSRGVMSDRKARQQRVGGELVCTAY